MAKPERVPRQSDGRKNHYRKSADSLKRDFRAQYQYSSEAYELASLPEEYEATPQRRTKRRKLTRKERIKIIRRRNAPKYIYEKQQERKISVASVVTAVLLFSGVLSYLLTFSLTAVGQQTVNGLYTQLSELKEDNAALKSGLYDGAELERVREIAVTKLGMVEPEEHQKVYIDIQKQSYFVQNDTAAVEAEANAPFDFFGIFVQE
ncbi:MAG: hypothetical protein LBU77_06450 [Clostridiales bacterium]|jgi:cell division protein FtsL|nr:hypothetical protein [Clostridiales bacterium]